MVFVVFDEFPRRRPAAARTGASTPSGSRTSPGWRRSPPGSRTRPRCSTRPSARCRRSSTGACRGRGMATDVRSHKPSIFHVLDGLGYEVFKVESASAVCPPLDLPGRAHAASRRAGPARRRRAAGPLPQVGRARSGSGRSRRSTSTTRSCRTSRGSTCRPGTRAGRRARTRSRTSTTTSGFDDPDLSEQNHLRHLLQVGYTDRLVGELLDRLERTGLLERALVVVTADHGYSFRVGVKSRRLISDDNVEEIAPVPLFVKAPGQMEGRGEPGRSCGTSTCSPTIADLLGTQVFYEQDGRSAFSREARERDARSRCATRDFSRHGADRAAGAERAPGGRAGASTPSCSARARRARCCTATRGRAPTGWARTPSCSAGRARLRADASSAARSARVTVANAGPVRARLARATQVLPTRVTGALRGRAAGRAPRPGGGGERPHPRHVARSFDFHRGEPEYFSFELPETALRPGPQPAARSVRRCPLARAGCGTRLGSSLIFARFLRTSMR